MQIQKLEESLGLRLFDRDSVPIRPTVDGMPVLDQMQKIVDQAQALLAISRESQEGPLMGTLRLGVIPTVASSLLPLLLPKVQNQHPGLRLDIQELQTDTLTDSLENDRIDVGLLALPSGKSSWTEIPLFDEPFVVLCQAGSSLSKARTTQVHWIPRELPIEDLWLLEEGHCLRSQVLDLCSRRTKASNRRSFRFDSGSLETLKGVIAAQGGWTLLPVLASRELSPKLVVKSLPRPQPARRVGLVAKNPGYRQRLLEALTESLRDLARDEGLRLGDSGTRWQPVS
jgi:LysR family hydrogen peroxide-inducible transcriptional activator